MPQNEDSREASRILAESMVQFRKLRPFPMEHQPCDESHRFRHSEIMVLLAIRELSEKSPQGASISDLSNYLLIKSPTVTPLVYRLEQEGMAMRSADPKDRRVTHIRLTEKGDGIIDAHMHHFLSYIGGLVEHLGIEKSRLLAGLLNEAYVYIAQTHKQKQK